MPTKPKTAKAETKAEPKKIKIKEKKFRYTLIRGRHVNEEGEKYVKGEIIHTDVNLFERHPGRPFEKWLPMGDTPGLSKQAMKNADNLDSLSALELHSIAEEEEIDVEEASTKEHAIRIIRETRTSRNEPVRA